jgi:RNA polymerase sigma-70 factor (ECF subfamily)
MLQRTEMLGISARDVESDEVLVGRVLQDDRQSFALLMRRYNQRLFRVARAIVNSDAEAEDVVQQAYVAAYVNLAQFEGTARFSTWLTRIAIHEALQRVRSGRRAREVLAETAGVDWPSATLAASTPEEEVSASQLAQLLRAAIGALPESCRVAVMLREIEGLSTAETAACLGLSEEAVRVRIHRARELLKDALFEKVGAGKSEVFHFAGARCDRMVEVVLARIEGLEIGVAERDESQPPRNEM